MKIVDLCTRCPQARSQSFELTYKFINSIYHQGDIVTQIVDRTKLTNPKFYNSTVLMLQKWQTPKYGVFVCLLKLKQWHAGITFASKPGPGLSLGLVQHFRNPPLPPAKGLCPEYNTQSHPPYLYYIWIWIFYDKIYFCKIGIPRI